MRKLCNKHCISKSAIPRLFKDQDAISITVIKKQADQLEKIKERAKKMVSIFRNKIVCMDDESYFQLKGDHLPGNDSFYSFICCPFSYKNN